MKSVAIICEYNLFHNGHLRQINMIREKFAKSDEEVIIISLMSGNWIQRGGPALLPARIRADTAARCGADLVLELPYPWSGGSAEYFARGAVDILNAIGGIEYLCFGSESGDIDMLLHTARNTMTDQYNAAFSKAKKMRSSGNTSEIILRSEIYEQVFGEKLPVLPNDILGLEYLRALYLTGSKIQPFSVKREGTETATETRRLFSMQNYESLRRMVPSEAFEIFINSKATYFENIGTAIIARLRLADNGELSDFEGVTGGLDRRLCRCAKKTANLEELFEMTATKRYTNARLRRTVINCILGVKGEDLKEKPCFTRLHSANKKGTDFLHERSGSDITVITKPAHQKRHSGDPILIAQLNRRYKAEALYSLARGESAETDIKMTPNIIDSR